MEDRLAVNRGRILTLTNFPETTARDDEGVVQGNESALTSNPIAESGIVGVSDELRPVTMYDPRPGLDEGVLDVTKEGWIGIEVRKSHSFQFETLAREVRVNELLDCATGDAGSIYSGEI